MAANDRPIRNIHNAPPGELPGDAPADAVRREFARRLQRAMDEKGWNQVELATRASQFMPEGKSIGRDSMSYYIAAKSFPTSARLHALAKALGMKPEDLRPSRGVKQAGSPAVEVRETEDGNAWLRVNQQVNWSTATKVLDLLKGEDK